MGDIRLTKNEKKVFRLAASGKDCPDTFPRHIFIGCINSLKRKGLVKVAFIEGGGIEALDITPEGRCLLAENPQLHNPIDWKWIITTGISLIAAIAAVSILFIACT